MLQDQLAWRYATKKFDPSKTVPQDKLDAILKAVQMAPTSSGLQPFEVIVVTNPDLRAQIQAAGYDQAQITEASHLLVFAAWDNYTEARIDTVVQDIVAQRGEGAAEAVKPYYTRLKAMYLPRSAEENYQHAARQAYIAFGIGLVAAAEQKVDATPMEGFDADKVDEILGLRARGLRAVTLLPVGYRATEGDWLAGLKKVRRPIEDLVHEAA